jgi:hypothetical protein
VPILAAKNTPEKGVHAEVAKIGLYPILFKVSAIGPLKTEIAASSIFFNLFD